MTSRAPFPSSWRPEDKAAQFTHALFMLEHPKTTELWATPLTRNASSSRKNPILMQWIGPCDRKRTPLCMENFNISTLIVVQYYARLATSLHSESPSSPSDKPSIAVPLTSPMPMPTHASIVASNATLILPPLPLASVPLARPNDPSMSKSLVLSKENATGVVKKVTM